jgi:hypothetical protein
LRVRVVPLASTPTCGSSSFCSSSVTKSTRASRAVSCMFCARLPMKLRAASVDVMARASSTLGRTASTMSLSARS